MNVQNPQEVEKVIEKGLRFLNKECKNGFYRCYLSNSRNMDKNLRLSPNEVASSLLILGTALKYKSSLSLTKNVIRYCKKHMYNYKFNFFEDKSLLPADADDTAWGLAILLELGEINKESIKKIVNKIINNVDKNGLIQVYFEPSFRENRIDHVAIANILYLINLFNKGDEVKKSEDYIYGILKDRKYLGGSRYYPSPSVFLYFVSRLIKFPKLKKRFYKILKRELLSHVGTTNYTLDLAARIIVAERLCISNVIDTQKLLSLQNRDGSWPADTIYHYGGKVGYFGSKSIATGFAVEALFYSL